MRPLAALMLAATLWPMRAPAQGFEFKVKHNHALGGCHGSLRIGPGGIEYRADKPEHSRSWPYEEIQKIKIESPARIEIKTYEDQRFPLGRDRSFSFELIEGRIPPEAVELMAAKSPRPVIASLIPSAQAEPEFQAPVKHLHTFGGCHGVLKVYSDQVVYESKKPEHSRRWRYSGIHHFGHPDAYRLEISAIGENPFNFQLKVALPESVRDYIWVRVYPSKFYPHGEPIRGPGAAAQPERRPESEKAERPSEPEFQTARVVLGRSGYEPSTLTLKLGVPARIEFLRQVEETCGTEIVIPEYGIRRQLPLNEPVVVEFTPERSGQLTFTCGMQMLRGTIVVK